MEVLTMRRTMTLALLAVAFVPALAAAAPLTVSTASGISTRNGGLLGSFDASAEGLSAVLEEFPSAEARVESARPVTFVVGLDSALPEATDFPEVPEVSEVPEPATLWMFGSGLALVASRLRKAKK
jgi:hypothetical protein